MARKRSLSATELQQRTASRALFRFAEKHGLAEARFPPFASWEDCKSALDDVELGALQKDPSEFQCDPQSIDGMQQTIAVLEAAQLLASGLASIQLIKNHIKPGPKGRCAVSLLSGMATDFGSIAKLIMCGYDVQAKIVTRTFGERLDLLIATQIDRAFAEGFYANSDIDDANRFWNKEVARGALTRRVSGRLRKLSASNESPLDDEWLRRRREMTKWLSLASHPSYLAGWFALLPGLGDERPPGAQWDGENGLFGQQHSISIVTGRAVFSRLLEFLYLVELRKNFFLGWDGGHEPAETIRLTEQPKDFLWKSLAESYFSPNIEFFEVYLAILGFKLVRVEPKD